MPQPQRKPSNARRREIAEAVLRVVGRRGVRSLTAATLAEEVGVTPGALYRHFASLDEIFEETTRVAVSRLEATFPSETLPVLERLRRLAERRIELFNGLPGLRWLLLSDQAYLTVPESAIEQLKSLVTRSRAFLLTALREGIADGTLRSELGAEALLVIFTGTVHQLIRASDVHATAPEPHPHQSERVLDALFVVLAPPTAGTRADDQPGETS